jgi:starch synthase
VNVQTLDGSRDVSLFEGKAPLSQAQLIVVGVEGRNRGESAALLACAARVLANDGFLKADVAVAWGETAALSLSLVPAVARLFVVPSGRVGGALSEGEIAIVERAGIDTASVATSAGSRSLAALGAAFANAIVAPSPSAARLLEGDRGFAERASDEPFIAVRFGCDDPPNDPGTDPALPANFSAKSLAGKLECRRSVTRRYSLALGPRTLLLGSGQLRREKGGEDLLAMLTNLAQLDVVILVPGEGDVSLLERARRLAVQSPGRMAVLEPDDTQERVLRSAADAFLCADPDDRTGRAAGLAQRYGALPIAFDAGAARDHLVDYDVASATGSAILFGSLDAYAVEGAVRRALALRSSADGFTPLVQRLMETAPRWSQTAAAFEEIAAAFV